MGVASPDLRSVAKDEAPAGPLVTQGSGRRDPCYDPGPGFVMLSSPILLSLTLGLGPAGPALFADGFDCRGARSWSQVVGETSAPTPAGQPALQCSWSGPPPGDPYPGHVQVLGMPTAADLPFASSSGVEIVFVAYNFTDGGNQAGKGTDAQYFGVLRVIDACTCEQLATIADPSDPIIGASQPALGDIDGNGTVDIVALRGGGGLVAFEWDLVLEQYVTWWSADATATELEDSTRWDGPALHDLDDDGVAEVISGHEVFDGTTGMRINTSDTFAQPLVVPTLAATDVDQEGEIELVSDTVYRWNPITDRWNVVYTGFDQGHSAVADFGTPTAMGFDPTTRDGIAEVVTSSNADSRVRLTDLGGSVLLDVATAATTRGAPAVADFDGDGRPEIAVADASHLRVLDLECETAAPGCVGGFVRWAEPVQELSSGGSTATAVDLDRDGGAEVVYADECFGRLYDGSTGDVLASWPRSSCTFGEGISVADVNGGGSAELLVPSNTNCNITTCPALDPRHLGLRCTDGSECLSGVCDAGLCRCAAAGECPQLLTCAAPLPSTPGSGDVCRAAYSPVSGLRVLGDPSEGWSPARPIWNQHTYSLTNVEADGSLPRTSDWQPNHATTGANDFRHAETAPPP